MKLSEWITAEMLNEAETAVAESGEVPRLLNVHLAGASLTNVKNFHAGIVTAILAIEECESVDQLILYLRTLQTALEATIAPSSDSSDP